MSRSRTPQVPMVSVWRAPKAAACVTADLRSACKWKLNQCELPDNHTDKESDTCRLI